MLGKPPWHPITTTTREQMARAVPLLRYIRRQYSITAETLQSAVLFLETARLLITSTGVLASYRRSWLKLRQPSSRRCSRKAL